jgi:hypothetical protein
MVYSQKEKVMLWALPVQNVFDYLSSSEKGLSDAEARKRLEVYGVNEIVEKAEGKVFRYLFPNSQILSFWFLSLLQLLPIFFTSLSMR